MAIMGFVLISTAICLIVGYADGKQLIRLRNGKECSMPGIYRDQLSCKKFYYCPGPHISEDPVLSHHQEEFYQIIGSGLMCPEGSIFDESIDACNEFNKVKIVPPECHGRLNQPTSSMSNTGVVHEITKN